MPPASSASSSSNDPVAYLGASGLAAVINFPLWKAAAIGQSGFATAADSMYAKMRILFGPPYKGVAATMFGMTQYAHFFVDIPFLLGLWAANLFFMSKVF